MTKHTCDNLRIAAEGTSTLLIRQPTEEPMLEMDTLGSMPLDPDDNRSLIQALEAMEDTIDDRAVVAIHARRALELDPACASALLVLAESATTRAERIALLKEVVSIGKKLGRASCRERGGQYVEISGGAG